MKIVSIVIFFSLITSLNFTAEAQNDFAKLEQNVNIRAKGLIHKLNPSKDTLILKSKALIQKVYSVNTAYDREVDLVLNSNLAKIPLNRLSKGKHVFVAVQSSKRIVFVVKIFRDNEWLIAMHDERLTAKND
ncbi:hypothetical protein [Psychroserpens sp. SPM9]|uniref:hypothetical protein n=1 Tax=Psychroserpens sp. SPM9 TaxID=2975598 RepID=UPI0021A5C700|nr:hypothetical protein [Psychroserpens sp. SPM9]MDG5492633.1 hypothetical protein [Psychroserpens sp. SPM9]